MEALRNVIDLRLVPERNPGHEEVPGEELPDRYSIRSRGDERELICSESPTLSVRVVRGLSISSSAARKSPPGSIYLDGAAEGEPFLDAERGVFNLDHHEGCLRSFTLATCEQAVILTRKGLDLRGRDWTIYANDPDLDTVFAIWVLLNHVRLNDSNPEIRTKVMPLIRLEGIIDAHGLEMKELCGFSAEQQEKTLAELEHLRRQEVGLKKNGEWGKIDFVQYTADLLRAIVARVYSSRHFQGVVEIDEIARAEIAGNKLAIVCRSEAGIYEVEPELRRLHGDRLGVIVLQKDPRTYTLRQVNIFLPSALESVYDRLNLMDPAAGNRRSGNRWGGSGEIGGSPRATGTSLTPQQISEVLAQTYQRPTTARRLGTLGVAVLEAASLMAAPFVAVYAFGWLRDPAGSMKIYLQDHVEIYAAVLCGLTGLFFVVVAGSRRKVLGMSLPAGADWLVLIPGALLGALVGGAWILPAELTSFRDVLELQGSYIAAAVGFPLAAEVLFRGSVHGTLAEHFSTQHMDGRWFLSWPVLISSMLYACCSVLPFLPFSSRGAGLTFAGALLFGISSGMARERSESLLPCLILHWSCLFMLVAGSALLGGRMVL
ncbi:MAG: lysostaphin resistance A-like protein [Thermodesulfobacteriota bacterium]